MQTRMQVGSTDCGEIITSWNQKFIREDRERLDGLSEAENSKIDSFTSSKKDVAIRSFKEKQAIDEFEDYNRRKRKEYASAKTKRQLSKGIRDKHDTPIKRMRRSLNFEPLTSDADPGENIMKQGLIKTCRKECRSFEYERRNKIRKKTIEKNKNEGGEKIKSNSTARNLAPNTIRKRKKLQKFAII